MESLGASAADGRTSFAVRSPHAEAVDLCLFDHERETRLAMERRGDSWFLEIPRGLAGGHYGFRADGQWAPDRGLWFDQSKLLVDPYSRELDRRFVQRPELSIVGADTAKIVPRAIVPALVPDVAREPPFFARGGLIYEL